MKDFEFISRKGGRLLPLFSLVLPLLLAGCNPDDSLPTTEAPESRNDSLVNVSSCDDLKGRYIRTLVEDTIYHDEFYYSHADKHIFSGYSFKSANASADVTEYLGTIASTGDTTYYLTGSEIVVTQTWPPTSLSKINAIDLSGYISYLDRDSNTDDVSNANGFAGNGGDHQGVAPLVRLALLNRTTLYVIVSQQEAKDENGVVMHHFERTPKSLIIRYSLANATNPNVIDITKIDGAVENLDVTADKITLSLNYSAESALLKAYREKYGKDLYEEAFEEKKYLLRPTYCGGPPSSKSKRLRQARTKLLKYYQGKITPDIVEAALPKKYNLNKDLTVNTTEPILSCDATLTGDAYSSQSLTYVVTLKDSGDLSQGSIGVFGEEQRTLFTKGGFLLLRDKVARVGAAAPTDEGKTNLYAFAWRSNDKKYAYNQLISVPGLVSRTYPIYDEKSNQLRILFRKQHVPKVHVEHESENDTHGYESRDERYDSLGIRVLSYTDGSYILQNFNDRIAKLSPSDEVTSLEDGKEILVYHRTFEIGTGELESERLTSYAFDFTTQGTTGVKTRLSLGDFTLHIPDSPVIPHTDRLLAYDKERNTVTLYENSTTEPKIITTIRAPEYFESSLAIMAQNRDSYTFYGDKELVVLPYKSEGLTGYNYFVLLLSSADGEALKPLKTSKETPIEINQPGETSENGREPDSLLYTALLDSDTSAPYSKEKSAANKPFVYLFSPKKIAVFEPESNGFRMTENLDN